MKKLIVSIAFIANIFAMQAQVRFIVQPLFEGVFSPLDFVSDKIEVFCGLLTATSINRKAA